MRKATIERATTETTLSATVNLDGSGIREISTGIGFLDHMLEQLARHSLMDVTLSARGDLHVDMHHTTEDCGIVLGQAVGEALGDMRGVRRYASAEIPMDEACARVALDLSGRPYLVWKAVFPRDKIGEMDTELFREWFHAFAVNAGVTLHVEVLYGENCHHMIEACFKGLARTLRHAAERDERSPAEAPSTKGRLGSRGS